MKLNKTGDGIGWNKDTLVVLLKCATTPMYPVP